MSVLEFFGYWGLILVGFVAGWSLKSFLVAPWEDS